MVGIIACPYSGTAYMKELLCQAGLDIGHELYGEDGLVSWIHAHFSKQDFIKQGFVDDIILLQQVRHPLMVISALRALHKGSRYPRTKEHIWKMVIERTKYMDLPWKPEDEEPIDERSHRLLPWMNLWYWWNKSMTLRTDFTYKVEDVEKNWERLCEKIGIESVEYPDIPKTINRKKTRKIKSWWDMYEEDADLTLRILDLAEYFGYEQIPYSYLYDPYYEFPDRIELDNDTIQAD